MTWGGGAGVDSLVASAFGADLHIFEPAPLALAFLRRNLRNTPHAIVAKFVSDHDARDAITIDSYCRTTGVAPTHLKLDIEGFEIEALRGMAETLRTRKPQLFIEFHERIIREERRLPPGVVESFFASLRSHGYRLEFNGHHHQMHESASQRYDYTWHDERPNKVNYAVIATAR